MTAPGDGAGIVLTNLGTGDWMGYEELRARRRDIILVTLEGNRDGSSEVDYTLNASSGFAELTGASLDPTNHVVPIWDVATGFLLSTGILAAERRRRATGTGEHVVVALSDVMLSIAGALGYLADAELHGFGRSRQGNYLYGAFGKDFPTADGRRVMVAAIARSQWTRLCRATGSVEKMRELGALLGLDLDDEGARYEAREAIAAVLRPWFGTRTLERIGAVLDEHGVLWGPYQDFEQLIRDDPRASLANPLFEEVEHPAIGRVMTPSSPLRFAEAGTPRPLPSPELGEANAYFLASDQTG